MKRAGDYKSFNKKSTTEYSGNWLQHTTHMCGGGLVAGDHVTSDALVVQAAHHVGRLRPHCIRHTCGNPYRKQYCYCLLLSNQGVCILLQDT